MRVILRLIVAVLLCLGGNGTSEAATFTLENGGIVNGEPLMSTASDAGLKVRQADDTYTNLSWGAFSQENLKEFLQDEKLAAYVEPFIIITAEDKAAMTHVDIKPVERLSRPDKGSLIGSLFGSSLGWILILLLTAANTYAGFEIALFRARNPWLVGGLALIPFVGVVSNIIWLSMPTYIEPEPELTEEEVIEQEELMRPDFKVPLAGEIEAAQAEAEGRDLSIPKDEVFARGKFTFNKRFFETRFRDFFGTVRRGDQKYKFLVIKSPKMGEVTTDRITRVTPTELYVNAVKGASGEVAFALAELQEVRLTVGE